jgi:hypothetical protein
MNTDNINNLRFCNKCQRSLPKTKEYFTTRKTDKYGFSLYCKECVNKEKRKKRRLKREHWDKGGIVEGQEGRKCTICKKHYPSTLDYFGKHKGNDLGLDTYCKVCRRERNRKNYYKSKEKWNKTHNKTKEAKKQFIIEHKEKSKGCVKCGENRIHLLDFHHIDPNTKSFQIGQGESKGWKKLKEEIRKCIILCSNCHRDFHHTEKLTGITIKEYLEN